MHQCPCAMAGVYRQRHPERSVFYRVLFHYFESFLLEYESRFEREYGYFRPIIQEVVDHYLDCGNPLCGFARIRCPECGMFISGFQLTKIAENGEELVLSQKRKFLCNK